MQTKFKHMPVTGMTLGQLYDAVANGEKFYDSLEAEIYESQFYCLESDTFLHEELAVQLKTGQITRLVETPWTDQLDGTWENGVWCKVWDHGEYAFYAKVTNYDKDRDLPFEASGTDCVYHNATPLTQDLADQLETLSKGGN